MGVHADLERALDVLVKGVGGHRDDRDRLRVGMLQQADRRRRRQSVHLGHSDVHQDRVKIVLFTLPKELDRLLAVFGMLDHASADGEQFFDDLRVDENVLCEQNAPAVQIGALLLLIQRHLVLARDALELVDDMGGKQRLSQKAVHAGAQRLVHDLIPVEGGQDDDRILFMIALADLFRELYAVHAGHIPVEEHQTVRLMLGMLYLEHMQGFFAAAAGIGLDAGLIQHQPRVLGGDLLVIDDQHTHFGGVEIAAVRALVIAVSQRDHNGELRADALL